MDSDKLLRRLIRKISVRSTIRRGAVARVAEHLGVSHSTVDGWIFGNREPRKAMRGRIEELILLDGLDLKERKRGRKLLSPIGIQRNGKLVA